MEKVCRGLCERAPDCGDGYACGDNGICKEAEGARGDTCKSEVECRAGLSCVLSDSTVVDNPNLLTATCGDAGPGHPAGAECVFDSDCRNHTCALGHCIDLCKVTRDCGAGTSCTLMPRIEAEGKMFSGCLQSSGALVWNVTVHGPSDTVKIAVPTSAQSIAITMRVDDANQKVGVTHLTGPDGSTLADISGDYYLQHVRHRPEFGQSVLAMPSTPAYPLLAGVYALDVRSLKYPFTGESTSIGTATPVMTAVAKLDTSVILDLHFYFLDLDEHPCAAELDGGTLDAETAVTHSFFQSSFVGELRTVFAHGGIALGTITYEDLRGLPDFDGLDLANAAELLKHGTHSTGINVFLVRSISPAGVFAYGPNPGPAGLANTAQSGVIVAIDSLCYRSWGQVADLTAHEIARYMGLYANVELDPDSASTLRTDLIDDTLGSDATSNLMYYSEQATDTVLTPDQRLILGKSPVLR